MKKYFLLTLILLVGACNSSPSKKVKSENVEMAEARDAAVGDMPVITFDKSSHDFGTINEGDKVETDFTFTNTGNSDLIITNATGSCGCTVPDYPKNTPIAPGATGVIKVKFDSANKPNNQTKTVTLTTNTAQGREVLTIKTFVTPDPIKQKQREDRQNAFQASQNK